MDARIGPLAEAERIRSLDTLRGFALLGILVMNIQSFAMPFSAYMNPTVYGDLTGVNYAVWLVGNLFFDQKFISMFSMMFGAGILLMTTRVAERGERPARLHYRRMLWLLLIGLLHAYVLWYGDILVLYALCGMLVYPMRKWKPRTLILLCILLMAIQWGISLFAGYTMPYWPKEEVANINRMWAPSPETVAKEVGQYRGGWLEQLEHRVPASIEFQMFSVLFFWKVAGLMLLGMAFHKTGVFAAQQSRTFYGRMVAAGVLIGLPLVGYGVYRNFGAGWSLGYSMFFGAQWNYWGSTMVSIGWVGALMLVCQSGVLRGLTSRLAAVGQMAFTNYLLHTILCTTFFYGHGLGYFGSVPRWGQALVVVGAWTLQLAVSPLWLRFFRFGPLEWAWRSLTYWHFQPLRRSTFPS